MASRNRTLAENNISKALDICPGSDQAGQLKMDQAESGYVIQAGKTFSPVVFQSGYSGWSTKGLVYFTTNRSSRHIPAKTSNLRLSFSGSKISQTDKPAEPVDLGEKSRIGKLTGVIPSLRGVVYGLQNIQTRYQDDMELDPKALPH